MPKQISIRISEDLHNKIKEHEHDFGGMGLSEAVRRMVLVCFHLTEGMSQHDKLMLIMKLMLEGKKDATN